MSRSKQQQVLEIEPLHELRFKGMLLIALCCFPWQG